ncbi:MAG: RNA pseudouridine synthase [Akkermansiaceae bacterium]|nr:RNA pseudouridine synthase [Akkermansiaceae bacterium]
MSLQVVVNFRVIDETDDWIVVDKPAPLIVHPANHKPEPTLLGGLEKLLAYDIANGASLSIITRLDRETSGIVLVSKHLQATRELGWIFERRQAKKEYLAIVHGWPEADAWVCDEPILRAGKSEKSAIWVRQMAHSQGKECRTRFQVECRFERAGERFSQIQCFPETGRMHQIRVHLASAGFPIVGDKIYSDDGSEYLEWMETGWTPELEKKLILPRHALHAARLEISWEGRAVVWESELSKDLADFSAGREISQTPDVVIWSRYD